MIYGERMYFDEETTFGKDSSVNESTDNTQDLINGFAAVYAVAEATDNYGLLDTYADMVEESCVESLNEGANAEYTKIFKEKFKTIKECTKGSRKAFKAGDYKQAKEYCKNGIKACDELQKEFDKVDDTVLTAILGYIINYFVSTLPMLIPLVGQIVVPTAGTVQGIMAQIKIFKDWKEKGFNAKTANVYRNKLEFGVKIMKQDFEAAIKSADEAMKNNK